MGHLSNWRHHQRRNQHIRRRWGVRSPKVAYTAVQALMSADALRADKQVDAVAYMCHCGAWHVGRRVRGIRTTPYPVARAVRFRSVNMWHELGDRATANLKVENLGSRLRRQNQITVRVEAAMRRRR